MLDALLIDDFFIRSTAWDGLIARTGIPPSTRADDFGPASSLHLRVLTRLKTIWHPAATRARGLFSRLIAGEPADSVLPYYAPGDADLRNSALCALRKVGDQPIDLFAIQSLAGHDRAWFEAALLFRVGNQETRAIAAAARLNIKGLNPALQEARKRRVPMSEPLRIALEAALRELTAPV